MDCPLGPPVPYGKGELLKAGPGPENLRPVICGPEVRSTGSGATALQWKPGPTTRQLCDPQALFTQSLCLSESSL